MYRPGDKFISLFVTSILLSIFGYGQSSAIKGRVVNIDDDSACAFIKVSLLQSDSTILQTTRTDRNGRFKLNVPSPAKYIIRVFDPAFNPYYRNLDIGGRTDLDVGDIHLQRKIDSLASVVVTSPYYGPRFKGDTLEYDVHNMAMNRNATIEELLRRLPGLLIAADGTITYNGQKIDHLTIDGENLFGGKPALITENLNADLIAKVQLFDQKSNQTLWTGIDDGTRTKTLNLQLRDDHKKGYSGKMEAGMGDEGYYNSDGIIGAFSGHRQIVALGIASNIGNTGFNSGNGSVQGGLDVDFIQDPLGALAGKGIPQIFGGGAHYADRWAENSQHVNGDVQYGYMTTRPYGTTTSLQLLPDTQYLQKQQSNSVNFVEQEAGHFGYDFMPDSLSNARIYVEMREGAGHNQFYSTANSDFNDTLVNSTGQTIRSDDLSQHFRSEIEWRMKFKKNSRQQLAVIANAEKNYNSTEGYVYTLNNYYQNNGVEITTDTTDQRKVITNQAINGEFQLSYANSSSPYFSWGVGLTQTINPSQNIQSSYNKGDGRYNLFVDSLSSNYKDLVSTQKWSGTLQSIYQQFTFDLTSDLVNNSYRQSDLLLNTIMRDHFFSFRPHLNIRDAIDKQTVLSLNYSLSFAPPPVSLLQPVQNNTNPLNITIGNPNLRGMYMHDFGGNFERLGPKSYVIDWDVHFNSNDIGSNVSTDSLGQQIHQPVNVRGSWGASTGYHLNRHVQSQDFNWGCNASIRFSHSYNDVNDSLNRTLSYNASGGVNVDKYVVDKWNFRLSTTFTYSYTTSSVDGAIPIHYWAQVLTAGGAYLPLPGTEVNSSLNYNWQQKTGNFGNDNTVILWNGFVSQDLWDHRIALRAGINDILNKNAFLIRSAFLNIENQVVQNSIGRYWMISAIYHFEHQRKGQKPI